MKERKAVAIRNKFTDHLKGSNYKGRDYAVMTRKMKKWLALDQDIEKWSNNWRAIAKAELTAILIMEKIKWHNKVTAWVACRVACL
jgi:hypothetical protein